MSAYLALLSKVADAGLIVWACLDTLLVFLATRSTVPWDDYFKAWINIHKKHGIILVGCLKLLAAGFLVAARLAPLERLPLLVFLLVHDSVFAARLMGRKKAPDGAEAPSERK
ncbi:MAG: hypothetical protein AB1921_07270 [Thermodesulfobacteriota bacterium]